MSTRGWMKEANRNGNCATITKAYYQSPSIKLRIEQKLRDAYQNKPGRYDRNLRYLFNNKTMMVVRKRSESSNLNVIFVNELIPLQERNYRI